MRSGWRSIFEKFKHQKLALKLAATAFLLGILLEPVSDTLVNSFIGTALLLAIVQFYISTFSRVDRFLTCQNCNAYSIYHWKSGRCHLAKTYFEPREKAYVPEMSWFEFLGQLMACVVALITTHWFIDTPKDSTHEALESALQNLSQATVLALFCCWMYWSATLPHFVFGFYWSKLPSEGQIRYVFMRCLVALVVTWIYVYSLPRLFWDDQNRLDAPSIDPRML